MYYAKRNAIINLIYILSIGGKVDVIGSSFYKLFGLIKSNSYLNTHIFLYNYLRFYRLMILINTKLKEYTVNLETIFMILLN